MQEYEGELFPVCYSSKKLNKAQMKYSTIEKECLAIVWGVKKFDKYIHGTSFILETDHNSLQYIDKSKLINSRIMRWAMVLQFFRMTVNAIKGKNNIMADYMSRTSYKE